MKKALIDTEYFLFTDASACQYEAEWAPDVWTYFCRHDDAKEAFHEQISSFLDLLPGHQPVLVFGSSTSFRYGVWPQYKANRKKYRKPAGYRQLAEWVKQIAPVRGWQVRQLPDIEGDDALGVLYEEGDVIVSVDKDMLTIPGRHLRKGELVEISRLEADRSFYGQVLTGDSSDNYPGCPGVGAVGAERLLAGCSTEVEMWQQVLQAFEKKGFSEPYAIQQARCARILRAGEYDMRASTPLLWSPPVA